MTTLLLLRHADAAAGSKDGSDFNRPLSAAGAQQARLVGGFLRRTGLAVDEVLCSDALRSRETADAVIQAAQLNAPLQHERAIYSGSADEILAVLRGRGARNARLLLVGHNPAVAELASLLASPRGLALAFPPATLAAIEFAGGWQELAPGRGVLQWLLPAALME